MSLHYIIDGYNIIRGSDWLLSGSLDDQRDRLLRFISERRPHGSRNNDVTVVFDGRPGRVTPASSPGINIIFSQECSADQVIKDRVDALPNSRSAVVVTDDRGIQKWVRGAGARVMDCGSFLKAGAGPRPVRKPRGKVDDASARVINEELKDLWKLK